ncbi:MAG: hypothetical protein ACN6OP_28335 [Pseudomonadales bacterium]
MSAILTTLLISLGFAPADARQDPCKLPGWAVSAEVAVACDFDDARTRAEATVPMTYIGRRTQIKFTAAKLGAPAAPDTALLISDRAVPVNDAPKYTLLLGATGGWVDPSGIGHGALDAWTIKLSESRISTQPAGTLVSLVTTKQPRVNAACFGDGAVASDANGGLLVCPNDVQWH